MFYKFKYQSPIFLTPYSSVVVWLCFEQEGTKGGKKKGGGEKGKGEGVSRGDEERGEGEGDEGRGTNEILLF